MWIVEIGRPEMKWSRDFSKVPAKGTDFLVLEEIGDYFQVWVAWVYNGRITVEYDNPGEEERRFVAWMPIPAFDTEDCFEKDQPDSEPACE